MARALGNKAPSRRTSKTAAVFEQDSDGSDAGSLQLGSGSELGADLEDQVDSEEDEEEERPKYAQFMDDSDLEKDSDIDTQDDDDDDEEADAAQAAYSSDEAASDDEQDHIRQQMDKISFSALMKAKQQLQRSTSDDDAHDHSDPDISDLEEDEFAQDRQRLAAAKAGKQPQRNGSFRSADADEALEQKRREVRERLRQLNGGSASAGGPSGNGAADDAWAEARKQREQRRKEAAERKELVKRSNKNAPTEVSSKRPVSRRRNVIETASNHVRDPRFESLSGSVNKDLFSKSYSFLPEMFKDELGTLKKTLAKLKKQEAAQAGPKAKSEQALSIREERAKVEATLRRAEGLAGERERRARESAVKGKIKSQNKERVEKGLLPFYPKKSEVKQMLLKDKYDRLSGGGNEDGKRASGQEKKQLKKALERRRKKNAQKEKKDMPAGIGFAREGNAAVPKRKRHMDAGESSKRSRF
ncbi:predicted rRNA processing protein [Pseudozyma hubeiensis SY62]|uniref:rRNA biogenesis protein RRP36 n=1 Tax=Pseudozyma hubeiensis (strain SY62) TaxID=1305764 RepID=R9P678_PSEHS|nr:predicted rRNA processing protein [Pseudozyma hubeiensis SY62]GAC96752.1 predicted rRNA processing protein [Pseudozyma hubeiensis SY62]